MFHAQKFGVDVSSLILVILLDDNVFGKDPMFDVRQSGCLIWKDVLKHVEIFMAIYELNFNFNCNISVWKGSQIFNNAILNNAILSKSDNYILQWAIQITWKASLIHMFVIGKPILNISCL